MSRFWKRHHHQQNNPCGRQQRMQSSGHNHPHHPSQQQQQQQQRSGEPGHLTPEAVASLPPPGLSGPSQPIFAPDSCRYLAFVSIQPASSLTVAAAAAAAASTNNNSGSNNVGGSASAAGGNQTLRTTTTTTNAASTRHSSSSATSSPSSVGTATMATPYAPLTQPLYGPGSPDGTKKSASSNATTTTTRPFITSSSTERALLCLDMEEVEQAAAAAAQSTSNTMATAAALSKPLLRLGGSLGHHPSNHHHRSSKRRIQDGSSSSSTESMSSDTLSLEERLRRERQRISSGGSSLTQFSWTWLYDYNQDNHRDGSMHSTTTSHPQPREPPMLRLLIPARGSLHIQDGILEQVNNNPNDSNDSSSRTSGNGPRCIHDKSLEGIVAAGAAIDPQLSPDGTMVAWTCDGELYVKSAEHTAEIPAIQLTFGAQQNEDVCITHGVADFVAQEEMDRYRGFWWHPDSTGILFTRTDESNVPLYRIIHQDGDSIDFASYTSTSSASSVGSTGRHAQHRSATKSTAYEDHRYPFAGKENPKVTLGFVEIDRNSIFHRRSAAAAAASAMDCRDEDGMQMSTAQEMATEKWESCIWIDPPREAPEYLARVYWLPDGSVAAQWQNRAQNVSVLYRIDLEQCRSAGCGKGRTLLLERSEHWINLHHMFEALPRAVHPDHCVGGGVEPNVPPMPYPLPPGSFSFLFASERSGFAHLHLYTYVPGINGEQAVLVKILTTGDWMVEHIVGVDMEKDVVYCTGTYDSPLERHLYAVPLLNSRVGGDDSSGALLECDPAGLQSSSQHNHNHAAAASPNGVRRSLSKVMHALKGAGRGTGQDRTSFTMVRPARLTIETGMHSVVMDDHCRYFVDTSSDLTRPTSVKIYALPTESPSFSVANGASSRAPVRLVMVLYDAFRDDKSLTSMIGSASPAERLAKTLPAPEIMSLPTSDGTETLHAALYRPDPLRHGPGPYPLVCAVYGGPHVQRVNRSWSQSADLRAQRLRSLGFCVVKCDNRGSSRRGIAFESAIAGRLGRLEVLDQVAVVRQLVARGIADGARVGVYGWSYGGYLSAMCLCRAPDVFHVAVAGAPVTSWDGYDTHYTERYMGLPSENPSGYREAAVFDHVPNMRGKLMIVHGLIDENVHFRHTARLINKLIAAGKDYDLLIFPEERHSPRRLRDRIYMEQRISDYFVRHLGIGANHPHNTAPTAFDLLTSMGPAGLRSMAGHL